jgi:hypothetical protein
MGINTLGLILIKNFGMDLKIPFKKPTTNG